MPTRSSGCAACRRRKVKCDETRPSCKRCYVHKIVCPGYRTTHKDGLEFLDETEAVAKRVDGHKSSRNSSSRGSSQETSFSKSNTQSTIPVQPDAQALIPANVDAAPQNRMQALSLAMNFYMPDAKGAHKFLHFTDVTVLTTITPSQPALVSAMETLSLVQIGTAYKDNVLLEESRHRYGHTLKGLMTALSTTGTKAYSNNEIIATISVLGFCEYFKALAQKDSWTSHVYGLHDMIKQRGPLPLTSPLELMLFHHARNSLLFQSLGTRRKLFFGEPEWLDVSRNGASTDALTLITDINVRLPGLLGDADNAMKDNDLLKIVRVETELLLFIRDLEDFLAWWYTTILQPPYVLLEISHFKTFHSLCDNDTFPEAMHFSSWPNGYVHGLYWLCIGFARSALLGLLLRNPNSDTYQSLPAIGAALFQNVRSLCQSVPYFCETSAGSIGVFATFMPMKFATTFFQMQNMPAELNWCRKVNSRIYKGGIIPPFEVEGAG